MDRAKRVALRVHHHAYGLAIGANLHHLPASHLTPGHSLRDRRGQHNQAKGKGQQGFQLAHMQSYSGDTAAAKADKSAQRSKPCKQQKAPHRYRARPMAQTNLNSDSHGFRDFFFDFQRLW